MSTTDEVVASRLERAVASPGLEEVDRLVYVQFILETLSQEFCIVEDSNARVPELGFEFFDGFVIERRVIVLFQVRIHLPTSWILRILAGF
jgi:hypothetical protein